MKTAKALLAFLLVLALAAPASAGWLVKEKSEGEVNTLYFQGNQVRDESPEAVSLLDLAQGRVTLINPGEKTYWSGPYTELAKMRDHALSQMQEQVKSLPPDQRAVAMQAMQAAMGKGNKPKPKVEVKKTSQSEVVAGFKAVKYEIWANGKLREELWIAKDIDLHKELDTKKMKAMMAAFAQAGGDDYDQDPAVQDLWSKGYPVKVVNHFQGEAVARQVVEAKRQKLPASLFTLPQGYRQVSLVEMFQ